MIEVAVIAIAWTAVFFCVLSAWRRKRFLLLGGALSLAVTLTLQADAVYWVLDPAVGGTNLINLAFRTSGLICFACFDALVLRALETPVARLRLWRVWAGAGLGIVAQSMLFFSGSWPTSSPHLEPYREDWRIIAYQAVFWVAIGLVAAHTGVATLRDTRGTPWTAMRVGVTLIGCATVPALLWCLVAVAGAIVSVPSQGPIASVLVLLTTACICVGVTITAVSSVLDRCAYVILIVRLHDSWIRARAAAPEVSLNDAVRIPWRRLVESAPQVLYRRWIEVEDAARLSKIELSGKEQRILSRVAQLMDDPAAENGVEELSQFSAMTWGSGKGLR